MIAYAVNQFKNINSSAELYFTLLLISLSIAEVGFQRYSN